EDETRAGLASGKAGAVDETAGLRMFADERAHLGDELDRGRLARLGVGIVLVHDHEAHGSGLLGWARLVPGAFEQSDGRAEGRSTKPAGLFVTVRDSGRLCNDWPAGCHEMRSNVLTNYLSNAIKRAATPWQAAPINELAVTSATPRRRCRHSAW